MNSIFSADEHWKKEFLGDNTAMLLTDVSREVKTIKEYLEEALSINKDVEDSTSQIESLAEEIPKKAILRQETITTQPRYEVC